MATHWVDVADGSDSNGGTSYGDAKQTLPACEVLMEADSDNDVTLNVVNSGTYNLTADLNETYISTGTTSQTFTFRGVDSAGDPALVTIESLSSGSPQRFFQVWRGNIVCENFYVDYAPSSIISATQYFMSQAGTGDLGDATYSYCHFRGIAYGTVDAGATNRITGFASNRIDTQNFNYCVFENMLKGNNSPLESASGEGQTMLVDHCVVLESLPVTTSQRRALCRFGSAIATGDSFTFTNNTMSVQYDPLGTASTVAPMVEFAYTNATTMANCEIHDNVLFLANTGGTNDATLDEGFFFGVDAAGPAIGATVFDVGYNVLYTDADFPDGDITNPLYYEGPFDSQPDHGSGDYFLTDTVSFGVADEDTLFNDMASTYAWSVNSNQITLTLPADARLIVGLTAGTGGALPGALPAGVTDYTVTAVTDRATYKQSDGALLSSGFGTITITNNGTNATGVVVAVTLPSQGITTLLSTPSQGTFDGAVWTVGALNDGASATLTWSFTVDVDAAGGNRTLSAAFSAGVPGTGIDTSDDTDSAIFLIRVPPPASGDPEDAGSQPFLDMVPVNADEWEMDLNVAMRTKRNRLRRHYLRSDIEGKYIREISLRRITVGTNISTQIVLGGIEAGRFLILESDVQVDVSAGNTTGLWIAGKLFIVSGGDFEQLHVRNNSTTVEAAVHYGVTD